ncbi:PH domain-containing protein [Lysobacter terrae]
MNRQEFAVQPVDARLVWLLPGIALVAALAGIGVLLAREPSAWIALPVLIPSVAIIAVALRRRRVSLDDGLLTIAAGLNTRRIAPVEFDLTSARVVDLREHREFVPTIKLFGTRVPGLSAGHFWLRDRSRAFVLLTGKSRVLVLTERSGRRLLLSLARPQALLEALQSLQRR